MNPELARRPAWTRIITLAAIFFAVVWTMLQVEFPTITVFSDYLRNSLVERQLQIQGQTGEGLLKQGWVYYNLGQYDKAEKVMQQVVKNEQNVSALYCLALLDLLYNRNPEAVDKLTVVVRKSPGHVSSRIALGKAYYGLEYYGPARIILEEAVDIEPTNEEARLWLGKAYLRLNKDELARSTLLTVTHGREAMEAAALLKNLHE